VVVATKFHFRRLRFTPGAFSLWGGAKGMRMDFFSFFCSGYMEAVFEPLKIRISKKSKIYYLCPQIDVKSLSIFECI
jgi:hypothetical protein